MHRECSYFGCTMKELGKCSIHLMLYDRFAFFRENHITTLHLYHKLGCITDTPRASAHTTAFRTIFTDIYIHIIICTTM